MRREYVGTCSDSDATLGSRGLPPVREGQAQSPGL